MVAALAHLRAEVRRRWPVWVAVVVVIGLSGGLAIGALAGARRTHTAFDRMVEDTQAWDVLVNPNDGSESALRLEDVAGMPEVVEAGVLNGVGAVLVHEGELTFGAGPLVLAAGDRRVLVDHSRPRVVAGSLYDPTDATHVMLDDVVAERYGIAAGDSVEVAVARLEELYEWELAGGEGPPPLTPRPATVTGVVIPHDGIVQDEAFASGHAYLTPAFAEAHGLEPFFFGIAVRLDAGADVAGFRRDVQALVPDEAVEFKTGAAVRDTVARGTMPHTIALVLFAAVVGTAGLVVAGQATTRQLAQLRTDAPTLAAMGLARPQLRRAGVARALVLVGAGSVLALLVAVALSPLFPVGVADRAEIRPGLDVDLAVLLPGVALFALVLLAWSTVAARRIGSPAPRQPAVAGSGRLERIATSLSNPVATTGLRASLAPGPSGRAAESRGALAGLSLAVAALAATVTLGAGIDHLVSTPSAYGWAWDAHLALPGEEWETPPEEIIARVEASPEVTGWSVLTMDQVVLDDERIPAVGVDYRTGQVGPTILRGRAPAGPDEVVLGGRTMDLLGVGLGDTVRAGAGARPMEVVGQAVFAGLGTYPGADRTELGKGALFTRASLDDVGEGFGFESIVIDAVDAAALDLVLSRVVGDPQGAMDGQEIEVLRSPAQPADVLSLARVRSTPLVIAGVLAVLGGVAFAFVLVSGVRSRRREIALLKTFGFRRRDIVGTVAWQATATAVVACAVGIPLGIVAGRFGWSVLADELGVGADGRVPLRLLALAVGVVLAANCLAVVPGVLASRTRAAAMLRAE
jgi:hypothetical protein